MRLVRIGIVGCGDISRIYFENFAKFQRTVVTACADIDSERARTAAKKFGIPWAGSTADLLNLDQVDMVVNLTIPAAHHPVTKAALEAGKLAYSEKPFSVERSQGQKLLEVATMRGLACGGAPDTFLGASHQTCRSVIDAGAIGEPIGFNAFMLSRGADGWHPNPAFFYQRGAGPLFDMGPYYLTVLTSMLGPIAKASAMARASFSERVLRHGPDKGKAIPVETPTHVASCLQMRSGVIGQLNVSFDVWGAQTPCIEIYGSEGTLSVPDPNGYGGPIRIRRPEAKEWEDVPRRYRFAEDSRGLGALDLAHSHCDGHMGRTDGALTYHVLDVMHTILESAEQERTLTVQSTTERPAPMPEDGPEDDI